MGSRMRRAEVTTLPSGLRIVTDSVDTVESAALGVWIGVGTRHEPAELSGVSHLLEHMAFKGTPTRGAADIAIEIESVGGHLNAYTSRESTAYYARVLKEDVPLALDIVADILQRSLFDAEEMERERDVILQEIGQAADIPEDVAFDAFQETAFPDQPVGRPVLGDPEVVRTVSREAMIDYMVELYRCPRMVVAAAGNVDHATFVDLATEKLADLRPGTSPEAEPSRYVGGERRIERPGEQVNLVFGFPGLPYGDPDYYAALVLSTLYGGGMSSRLFQEIREKRGLVYSVYSFASSLSDSGVFGVYAGTGPEEADDVLRIAGEQLRDVAASAGEDETQRARAQLKAHLMMSMESTASRAEQAANQLLIYGRLLDPAEVVAELEVIDSARIRSTAERLLAGPMTLTAVGPIGGIAGFERVCGWFR